MTIQVGESLPQVTFRIMTADGPVAKTTDDLFKGRNVVLVAVPGLLRRPATAIIFPAMWRTCRPSRPRASTPSLVTAVNDVFVMDAGQGRRRRRHRIHLRWQRRFCARHRPQHGRSGFGLGTRSQRYSMVVENGVVKSLNVEDAPAKAQISGAETCSRTSDRSTEQPSLSGKRATALFRHGPLLERLHGGDRQFIDADIVARWRTLDPMPDDLMASPLPRERARDPRSSPACCRCPPAASLPVHPRRDALSDYRESV